MDNNMSDLFDINQIKTLLQKHYVGEIADMWGVNPNRLRHFCRKHGLKSKKKKGMWNEKYDTSFRKKAISLFKRYDTRTCAKMLGLTHGQMIGLLETSRRSGLLPPRFKDKRNKEPWNFEERLHLIQLAGLVGREEIGRRLNRCGYRNIKERMSNDFKSGTKFLHGMPLTWVKEIIPIDLSDRLIQTKAGPSGQNGIFFFKIVSWQDLEQAQYAIALPLNVSACIRSMAKFQRFIFQDDRDWVIRKKLEGVINGK